MTRKLLTLGGIGVLMLAVVTFLMWFLLKDPLVAGPSIKGKPVTFWTRQLRVATFDVDAIGTLVTEKDVALPALVRQLSLHDSLVRDSVKSLWRQLPAGLRGRLPKPMTNAELRAGAATALMLIYTNDVLQAPEPSLSEAQILFPALTNALHDRDHFVRLWAAAVLSHLKVIAPQAIAACGDALQDPHRSVRANAVYSLGELARRDERAVPLLRSALSDSDPDVRARSSQALKELGISPDTGDPPQLDNSR